MLSNRNIHPSVAIKTNQFYRMLIIYGFCSTGGYALLASSKAIMGDIFIPALPHLIDANFFSTYAILLGFGSLIGRIGYSIASDTIGRRNMYHLYSIAGGSLFFALPSLIKLVIETGSVAAFYGFVASTFLISSLLGGTFSTFPAYASDFFGSKYIGAIYGRIMLGVLVGI